MASGELSSLVGWVKPYLLERVVVKLARSLGRPIKAALCLSGPELPLKVSIDDPDAVACDECCTHRILIAPDDGAAADSVRLQLLPADSDEVKAERTVRWDGDPASMGALLGAIRELAGLAD